MLQPPGSGARENDVLGARRALRLEPGNRLSAVGRVVAGIRTIVVAREMPRPATVHPQQLLVSPADDEHGGVGGDSVDHRPPNPLGQLSVSIALAAFVGLPRFLPLAPRSAPGSPPARGRTRRSPRACRTRSRRSGGRTRRRRRAAGSPPRARAASNRRPRAVLSRNARRAGRLVVHLSANRDAEHRQGRDLERLARMLSGSRVGERQQLRPRPVVRVHLGLVAGAVGRRVRPSRPRPGRGGAAGARASPAAPRCRR